MRYVTLTSSLYMYILYIWVCVCVNVYTCVCKCVHVCVSVRACVRAFVRVCERAYRHNFLCTAASILCKWMYHQIRDMALTELLACTPAISLHTLNVDLVTGDTRRLIAVHVTFAWTVEWTKTPKRVGRTHGSRRLNDSLYSCMKWGQLEIS